MGFASGMASGLSGGGAGSSIKKLIGKMKSKGGSSQSGSSPMGGSSSDEPEMQSYKKGGKVRKTGPAKLHKGERVLTVKQAKKYRGKKG